MTWAEAGEQVSRLAAGLLALGLEPEQRVGIASGTRYEWILADLAVMCAGGATTTVYPSTNAEDTAYILSDSECRVVFAEDDEQIAKLKDNKAELPHLAKVVTFDGTTDGDWVIGLDDLGTLGDTHLAEHPGVIAKTAEAIGPDQLATLIYTSGTTGRPRACGCATARGSTRASAIQAQDILERGRPRVPLAADGPLVRQGAALHPARDRLRRRDRRPGRPDRRQPRHRAADVHGRRAPDLREGARAASSPCRPPRAAPRRRSSSGPSRSASPYDAAKREGRSPGVLLNAQHALFDILVFGKVRERFGGRVRFFISGAAALNQEIAEWFHAAGILILEGYGLTESSAGSFVNLPDDYKMGIGRPGLPRQRGARSATATRSRSRAPGVMDGYHNLPEETASTLTEDGWLRTGDKGAIDADGFLTITGRIKELFKTSGGKYIAPAGDRVEVQGDLPLRQPVRGVRQRAQLRASRWSPSTPTRWATGPRRTTSPATTPRS